MPAVQGLFILHSFQCTAGIHPWPRKRKRAKLVDQKDLRPVTLWIPPVPSSWPFQPREEPPTAEEFEDRAFGELGAGWRGVGQALMLTSGPWVPLEGAYGRGGLRRCGDLVLRPYRRGGWVRFFNQGSYLSPRRFEREWEIHRALWIQGFPTVSPAGFGWRRQGLLFEGLFMTRWEEGLPWPRDWRKGLEGLSEIFRAVEALAEWGLLAPDLNATNVLLKAGGGVALLDWDRAAFLPGQNLRPAYRLRMARSLAKLGAPQELREAWEGLWKA
ncbi:MAG: hypothetical protein HY823_02290 [Acidobacteria bacterium]|nr:hypothetical protein [Acidobacteriota bacterium]